MTVVLPPKIKHGTNTAYTKYKCHCDACRTFWYDYRRSLIGSRPCAKKGCDAIRTTSSYCRECMRVVERARPKRAQIGHSLKLYGLTKPEFDTMLERQGGVCLICSCVNKNGKSLSVDHCHKTGVIRGLICNACNLALGNMYDDPARLRAGADYLEDFFARQQESA